MSRYKASFFLLLLGLLYGSTLVVSRFSVGQYDPRTYISLRLILATLGYVLFFQLNSTKRWPRDASLWTRAAVLGVIGTAIPMVSMISSLQYQSSGVTSLLITLSPVGIVILAHFFLPDERLNRLKVAGALVAFAGAGLLLVRGETGLENLAQANWRGYAWSASGIIFSSISVVYARRYLRNEDLWDVSSVRMLVAAAVLLPITFFSVGYDMSRVTTVGYMGLIYASVAGTFCGMWLNFYIVKRFGATTAAQVAYILPIITTILGALVLGEEITATMIIGMVIIFSGLMLINWRYSSAESIRTSGSITPGGNPISSGKV